MEKNNFFALKKVQGDNFKNVIEYQNVLKLVGKLIFWIL